MRRWLLPASLALNAFLLGAAVIVLWRGPPLPPEPQRIIEAVARDLPEADAALLRAAFATRAQPLREGHQAMVATPARLAAILAAPEFDAAALSAAIDAGRAGRESADAAIGAALLEATTAMSPLGRRQLAAWRPSWR